MLEREAPQRVVVDALGGIEAVAHRTKQLAAQAHRGAVGQMAAVRERHAEDRVAGLEHREVHRLVRLRAGVRLHVRVFGAVEPLNALDREALGDVHVLAAAVVAFARIALGVLVGERGPECLQHRGGAVVLGGDQLQVLFLARALGLDRPPELRIGSGERRKCIKHGPQSFRVLKS